MKVLQFFKWRTFQLRVDLIVAKPGEFLGKDQRNIHVEMAFEVLAILRLDGGQQLVETLRYATVKRNVLGIFIALVLDMPD